MLHALDFNASVIDKEVIEVEDESFEGNSLFVIDDNLAIGKAETIGVPEEDFLP